MGKMDEKPAPVVAKMQEVIYSKIVSQTLKLEYLDISKKVRMAVIEQIGGDFSAITDPARFSLTFKEGYPLPIGFTLDGIELTF